MTSKINNDMDDGAAEKTKRDRRSTGWKQQTGTSEEEEVIAGDTRDGFQDLMPGCG